MEKWETEGRRVEKWIVHIREFHGKHEGELVSSCLLVWFDVKRMICHFPT